MALVVFFYLRPYWVQEWLVPMWIPNSCLFPMPQSDFPTLLFDPVEVWGGFPIAIHLLNLDSNNQRYSQDWIFNQPMLCHKSCRQIMVRNTMPSLPIRPMRIWESNSKMSDEQITERLCEVASQVLKPLGRLVFLRVVECTLETHENAQQGLEMRIESHCNTMSFRCFESDHGEIQQSMLENDSCNDIQRLELSFL